MFFKSRQQSQVLTWIRVTSHLQARTSHRSGTDRPHRSDYQFIETHVFSRFFESWTLRSARGRTFWFRFDLREIFVSNAGVEDCERFTATSGECWIEVGEHCVECLSLLVWFGELIEIVRGRKNAFEMTFLWDFMRTYQLWIWTYCLVGENVYHAKRSDGGVRLKRYKSFSIVVDFCDLFSFGIFQTRCPHEN